MRAFILLLLFVSGCAAKPVDTPEVEEPVLEEILPEVEEKPEEILEEIIDPNMVVSPLDGLRYYPEELSGGEKQRVAIARALAHEPDILIADEATGMIDPDSSDEVIEILEKINSLGTTVIMATHDQRIVDKLNIYCCVMLDFVCCI